MGPRTMGLILLVIAALGGACGGDEDGGGGISLREPIGDSDHSVSRETDGTASAGVAKSAFARMTVPRTNLDSAAQEVVDLATRPDVGGFLVSSVFDSQDGYGSARVLVNVPSAAFEVVVGKVGGIGDVTRQELTGQDMSPQLLESQESVRRARSKTADLISRLERTDHKATRFKLGQQLRTMRMELRNARREAADIGSELAFSEVDISLHAAAPPPPQQEPVIERALVTAKAITLGIGSGAILLAAVVVPVAALLFLLFLLGGPILRRLKARLRGWPA